MTKEEIIKIFNDFRAEYNFEKYEQVWRNQSEKFRQFWREKVLNGNYPELSEADMDYVIRFFDKNAKGAREFRENGGEHAARAGIYQGMWYRALKDLKNKQDIREILNQIFEAKDDSLKMGLVNKLEKINQKNKNGLTGRSAIILNALLFTYNPDQYLTMLSINHRFALIDFFGLGDPKQYKTYGEQVIKTNNDIVSGFKEKHGIDTTPLALSHFVYECLEKIYHWKKVGDFSQETTDDIEEEGEDAGGGSPISLDRSGFVLEKHLEDFLVANWESTELGELYDLIEENGNMVSQQYPTKEIGNIDLLVQEKKSGNYVVIELKKGLTSDQTVGQLTRYIGWVKKNKSNGKKVKGIIIAGSQDERLKYALEAVPDVDLLFYRIDFILEKPKER